MATTSQARRLFGPLVLLATYLVISAYVRSAASIYPPTFGSQDWRFGAFGFLIGDSPVAVMGLGVLVTAAAMADHRGWIKGSALVAAVFALVSAAMLVSFWRDGASLMAGAEANTKAALASAARRTMALGLVNVLGFGAVAWGGMLAARGSEQRGDDPALAVGRRM